MGLVAKKEARCDPDDPADDRKGDHWDHVALDPDHRLVVSVVPGKRTAENTGALVRDFHRRTGGRLMGLITTDEFAPDRGAILDAYGEAVLPPRTGKRGRPRKAFKGLGDAPGDDVFHDVQLQLLLAGAHATS